MRYDHNKHTANGKGSIVRWDLKEAGGKTLVRRIETLYEGRVWQDEAATYAEVQQWSWPGFVNEADR